MPFPFKLSTRFTSTKWNDQGKRPRADTVQVDEVVASFTAMANGDKLLGFGGEKRNQDHLIVIETPEEIPQSITPEQEQREMVQNIAARVLAMQQPDTEIVDEEIPLSKTSFVGSRIPAISFVKYVERLVHNINRWAHEKPGMDSVGVQSGVFAIEYLERSCAEITPRSIHRFFLAAFLVGIKYSFDYYLSTHIGQASAEFDSKNSTTWRWTSVVSLIGTLPCPLSLSTCNSERPACFIFE
jgi:hypothetical protein